LGWEREGPGGGVVAPLVSAALVLVVPFSVVLASPFSGARGGAGRPVGGWWAEEEEEHEKDTALLRSNVCSCSA
jgi:hypothetical protein